METICRGGRTVEGFALGSDSTDRTITELQDLIAAKDVEMAAIDARVNEVAARLKRDPVEVRASLEKNDRLDAIEENIVREKIEAFLLEKAKIKEAKE